MIIALTDTNKIYGMFRAFFVLKSDLSNSQIYKFIKSDKAKLYVSKFILDELYVISLRYWINANKSDIINFVKYIWFIFSDSKIIDNQIYSNFVNDIYDAQILQDAIDIKADYILTDNTKDFEIVKIYSSFGIKVISSLDEVI